MDNFIFPPFEFKTKKIHGKTSIFDLIRKKYIQLTPEEWVRQHLIHFLIKQMNYPKTLIVVEDGHKVNKMAKRSDVVVYDRNGNIFMLVECKSAKVKLTQKSMDQASMYNQKYKAQFLTITNGLQVVIYKMDYSGEKPFLLHEFPVFQ